MPRAAPLPHGDERSVKVHLYATWSRVRRRYSKVNLNCEHYVWQCFPTTTVKRRRKPRGQGEFAACVCGLTSVAGMTLFPIGPMSSALLCSATGTATTGDKPAPPAKGAFSPDSSDNRDKEKEHQKELALCKIQHQASLSHRVEEFFWIGSSIMAFSRWRLGYMVEKCMSCMQTGTQMVKLRGGSKGLVRYFYLDQHKSCIRWRPSRKNEKAKISIDSIREVCEGKQSEIFQRYSEGSFDPNCCFSLYYGEHMESLDLVSGTGEEARTWITGLKYLMAGISDEDSLAKRQRTHGTLSISEVLQLLHKLNVNLPRQKVKQMFKEADTDDNQGTLDFEEFCSFYKMMSTRRDLYLLMLTYSNHKDHMDADDIIRFLEIEQKMTKVTKDHCLEIINKFEPCSQNQKQGVLGIDGFTNYMRSPAGDIFRPEHYEVNQDMDRPLCHYFIASSHNTYLMGDQLMSQSRVDMYTWVLQAGCRCVEVDCWDGQDGEPIVHHGYTLTSKILFKDVIETINKYAFIKNDYPVILSIENHCSVPQQKKMAEYLSDILGDKLDLSSVKAHDSGHLPSPDSLRGKILVKGKKLPPNIDEDAEEGDVSDEDSADEMEDDCKLMNGDTSANRKQVESLAKKKLDSLMKESKIRDREDPDSFTIAALPPAGKPTPDKASLKSKGDDGTDTADESNSSGNKRGGGRSFMGSFSKRKKKASKLKKASSLEDTDTDQESSSSASRAPLHHNKKKKTMKLSRALSDLVKYTRSVGLHDIDAQAASLSWQVSSLSETKAHQVMMQKAAAFIHFNQRQLSRIYPSSYRVDSSNFNPQPFWNAGCQLVALNYQSEGRVLQLNRAKFYSNGNCGYILKPTCMCEGAFNPHLEDPLPGQMKKQLVLKIISGQQLPKPKDSMLGDRGEIIDPFVEVEVIGLPVDCCKEQTRVVDDNGFNPMWEETLVFTLHMAELALVRFLVWDHDPIGQDFIGQRTIAFNSMMPGYRHVYLEGMEEASIFVHIAVHDITGKARAASGIKGLFHRNPKQASLDSHAAAQLSRKHPFGAHLLRRTASAPTKGQPKVKKGLPEIAIDTKDYSSEGASEDRESEEQGGGAAGAAPQVPTFQQQHQHHNGEARDHPSTTNGAFRPEEGKGKSPRFARRCPMTEPLKRVTRLRQQEPLDQGVFARVALNGSGRVGMSSNCIACVVGTKESPEAERKARPEDGQTEQDRQAKNPNSVLRPVQPDPVVKPQSIPPGPNPKHSLPHLKSQPEPGFQFTPQSLFGPVPFTRSDARKTLGGQASRWHPDPSERNARSCSVPRRRFPNTVTPARVPPSTCHSNLRWQYAPPPDYVPACFSAPPAYFSNGAPCGALSLSDSSSSCNSWDSLSNLESPPMLQPRTVPDSRKRAVGTLQREMNALFAQKMEELRSKSPMFFAECVAEQRPAAPLPHLTSMSREEAIDRALRHSGVSTLAAPAHHSSSSSSHRTLPPSSLPSPSTAITTAPTATASPNLGVVADTHTGHPTARSHPKKPLAPLSRTTSSPGKLLLTKGPTPPSVLPQCGQDPWVATSASSSTSSSCTPDPRQVPMTNPKQANGDSHTGPLASVPATQSPSAPTAQRTPVRRALFTTLPSHPPVRRSKSEGHVLAAVISDGRSCVPEVCTDATMNDRLWSKVDPGSHRDSMSSSSSISSSDTVIDLSMPNLVRKSLTSLPMGGGTSSTTSDSPWVSSCRSSSSSSSSTTAGSSYDSSPVGKSKSNPNLWQGAPCPEDELNPRPLGTPRGESPCSGGGNPPRGDSPGGLTQRRHTWSRLYMEGLKKQSSSSSINKRCSLAASPSAPATASSMSKSLGDLTSDDIACNFDSKYRSISRSFVMRPPRDQLLRRGGSLHGARPASALTEQLRRLTDVEPLTASDFSSPAQHSAGGRPQEEQQQEEVEEEPLARRTSSRSQSRVRYIANRAKQAQERQRLQGLTQGRQPSFSGSLGSNGSPIEERGNPEGACCVARSPCTSPDLLGQLASFRPPAPRPPCSPQDPDNKEVFFMLKL
ncbi:1-phosphatidylinositol 4,5-bisphosphate phosphodiesterase eta-2 [Merluccius polli]|uniref:Phosphoinositide phospholipase C n=1 Tax=Merluccius polli TaxID=89951 RepID=A0AA47NE85_MERPO|nr:1-phosphatidylinositol 4,5-bisphosphate phosphodiesterase eta-2 [Merluccius polli]